MHEGQNEKIALAIFAHADDETLLAGALIAKFVSEGWKFHLLCIAPGNDDDRTRRMELAANELGMESVSSLRFASDGQQGVKRAIGSSMPTLITAPESVVANKVEGKIAEVRPSLVITHSPSGDYGHPEHMFCHRVAVKAVQNIAPEAELYALAWSGLALKVNSIADRIVRVITRSVRRSRDSSMLQGKPDRSTRDIPATDSHNVAPFLKTRKRAAAYYRKELSAGPLPLRMLEAAPTWLQRPVFGRARLSRILLSDSETGGEISESLVS